MKLLAVDDQSVVLQLLRNQIKLDQLQGHRIDGHGCKYTSCAGAF